MKHRNLTTIFRTLAALSLFASFTGYSSAALIVAADYDFSGGTPAGGTLVGNATISGGVLNLDGAGDYLSFASTPLTALDNFVVEAIFNINANGTFNFMVYNGNNNNQGGQGIYQQGGNLRGILPGLAAAGFKTTTAPATLNTNFAMAFVHNAGTSTIYVNGTAYTPTNSTSDPTIAASRLLIGAGLNGSGVAEGFFNGTIDRVRLSTFTAGTFSSADLLTSSQGTIPEPSSMLLVSVAGLMAAFRRRRV